MPERVLVRDISFRRTDDVTAYLDMLDAYARDPMGAGGPLPDEVYARLARDLPANPLAHGLLAEQAGTAVGFATCFVGYSTFRARPLLNIHDIAVTPQARGQGVAGALLGAIADLGRRLGCCKITLEVRDDNGAARHLYARDGFLPSACNLFLEKPL
jgi:ribosomal protein S18 acetylase RimI-like enzyme